MSISTSELNGQRLYDSCCGWQWRSTCTSQFRIRSTLRWPRKTLTVCALECFLQFWSCRGAVSLLTCTGHTTSCSSPPFSTGHESTKSVANRAAALCLIRPTGFGCKALQIRLRQDKIRAYLHPCLDSVDGVNDGLRHCACCSPRKYVPHLHKNPVGISLRWCQKVMWLDIPSCRVIQSIPPEPECVASDACSEASMRSCA